jgi:uncharacterized protein (TIGR02145 family)
MKKIFTLILGITLAYSCSTSSEGNGNSNASDIPLYPTNLTGELISPTQTRLTWTDNSSNETGFKIYRKVESTGSYSVIHTTTSNVTTYNDTGLITNTTYYYKIKSYNAVGSSSAYSNEIAIYVIDVNLPLAITSNVSSVTNFTAVSGGNALSPSGANITARGVCWSTSPNPTTSLSTKTNNGTGAGQFTSNLTNLTQNTLYYVKAYATNSIGTSYGNEITFTTATSNNVTGPQVTDIDGNLYQSVTNCSQTWFRSNLRVSKYSDGTPIPQVTDPTQWGNLTTGAWCYYNNDPANDLTYGKLYNWYAIAGIHNSASLTDPSLRKKLAPVGWHIPTDNEWTVLVDCRGGDNIAGGILKQTLTVYWQSPNTAATNTSGFTARGAGLRGSSNFTSIRSTGIWWSSTQNNSTSAWRRSMRYSDAGTSHNTSPMNDGLSVRCVKD